MGFTEFLTIIFVLLKVFGKIDWSWWLVFLPELIAVAFYLLYAIWFIVGSHAANRRIKKTYGEFFDPGRWE